MKPVIAWMKSNLAIVALSAVIIVTLPAAYIGSSMWNKRIRESRTAEASKAMTDLTSLRVTYTVPSPLPGGESVSFAQPGPNQVVTEHFREHRKQLEEQVGRVVTVAQEVNSQGRRPLVDGVFPKPTSRVKTLELAEVLIGRDGRPSAYTVLLRSINAGEPADPIQLEAALEEHRTRAMERIEAETGRQDLTSEESADLEKEMTSLRLGYYQQHARQLSVYAGLDLLPREVPTSVTSPPNVDEAFLWQFDYWTISDLLRAVDNANTVEGDRLSVEEAVVKRIESITLEPLVRTRSQGDAYSDPSTAPIPVNPITGRSGGPTNDVYDIRNARMALIVSSEQLPQLIDAISRTNFMTVIGLDFEEIDPWEHLEEGYYYGEGHVIRATVRVETIWLRNWTTPLMPAQVRLILTGIEEVPEAGGEG